MARLLFLLAHSTDEPDRAVVALEAAAAAAGAGHDVALWLSGEGVRLGVEGLVDTLREPGGDVAAECLEALAAGGTTLYCQRACFERRAFEEDVLRPEARLSDPRVLAELVADGYVPLTI